MKRNSKKLIELSKNYLEYIEILLPELEKEILLRIINSNRCIAYKIPFGRGELFIDLLNTSDYKINIPGRPSYIVKDRISLDVIDTLGMPNFTTVTASRCRSEEDFFIRSILTEILSNVRTGKNLVSVLREIRSYCEINTYFVPRADFDASKIEVVCVCSSSIGYKNEELPLTNKKKFEIYYKVDGDENMKSIVIGNFNSIGFARRLVS